MSMLQKMCDWIGFVWCESAFQLMPDDLVERCLFRALGATHTEIDEYVHLVNYADYPYYDHAFFLVGSALYRVGCLFYAMGEASGPVLIIPKRFGETDDE